MERRGSDTRFGQRLNCMRSVDHILIIVLYCILILNGHPFPYHQISGISLTREKQLRRFFQKYLSRKYTRIQMNGGGRNFYSIDLILHARILQPVF